MALAADFSAEDIRIATNGAVDNKRLQNWAARELWLTPTAKPDPGKPKGYTRANMIEAVIANALREYGFKDETARAVIKHRLRGVFASPRGGYVKDYVARFEDLPEWKNKIRFWLIVLQSADDHWGQMPMAVLGCKTPAEVAKHLKDIPYVIVFDVMHFMTKALDRLEAMKQ